MTIDKTSNSEGMMGHEQLQFSYPAVCNTHSKGLAMKVIRRMLILIAAVLLSAGTAGAAVFTLLEEDFSGTPGDNLTTKGWMNNSAGSGAIQLQSTEIDEGNSGATISGEDYVNYKKPFPEFHTLSAGEELITQWSLRFAPEATGWSRAGLKLTGEETVYAISFNKDEVRLSTRGGTDYQTGNPNSFFPRQGGIVFVPADTLYDLRTVITGGDPNIDDDDMIRFEHKGRLSDTWETAHSAAGTFLSVDEVFIDAQNAGLFIDTFSVKLDTPVSQLDGTWTNDGTGSWTDADNWNTFSSAPNTSDHSATFGNAISAPTSVIVDTDVTINAITFDHSIGYGVGGVGSLNLVNDSGEASPRISVVQGDHQLFAVTNLNSDTLADIGQDSTLSANHALNLTDTTLTKVGDGTLYINNQLTTGGGAINVLLGTVAGVGTIGGDLMNNGGTISPGNIPGLLTSAATTTVPEPSSLVLLVLAVWALRGWFHSRALN